jgi:hypothetical protein
VSRTLPSVCPFTEYLSTFAKKRKGAELAGNILLLGTYDASGSEHFTEYLSTFFGLELFSCPNGFTPCQPFPRGKIASLGHLPARISSNIL